MPPGRLPDITAGKRPQDASRVCQRDFISTFALKTPQDCSGGAEKSCWKERLQENLACTAATVTNSLVTGREKDRYK